VEGAKLKMRLPRIVILCVLVLTFSVGSTLTGSVAALRPVHAGMVLDWYPNSDHGGIYTAISRGYFSRHGIEMDVHVPSDTSAQITLVAAGRADFGVSYETDLLAARARGVPVRSVMCIMQHPLDTVMSLKSSGITRPRQLVGKTIGIAGSPSDEPIVQAMMAADGASVKKAHLVNVGYNLLPALLAHRVDAVVGVYWTWEAIQARMRGQAVNVMRVERWGVPNYCELVLIAGEKTIQTRPAFVRDVVHAMQQGYAYAAAHPEYAWNALHAADRTLDRSLVLQSLKLLRSVETDARTIGYQDPDQWSRYARWLAAKRLITRAVNASRAFTNQFLQPGVS
jgi:putative hydroxymethylpyrimidine transport system substrate-binding protein